MRRNRLTGDAGTEKIKTTAIDLAANAPPASEPPGRQDQVLFPRRTLNVS